MTAPHRPTVILIGAGFGGLNAAHTLANTDVDVLIIDRHNFHLFTPLLYQVATSGLDPSEIAYPVRGIFRNADNIRFLMGSVEAIDTAGQTVTVRTEHQVIEEHYDYLIVAAGSKPNYFGQDAIREHAFDLKTLWDAVTLRNHILRSFEQAAWIDDPAERAALTTMVVVGGGPTGLETAGALYELVRHVLRREYHSGLPDTPGRVILVEMQDHVLNPYPPRLQRAAYRQLESLGVEVILGTRVVEAGPDHIRLDDGTVIGTHTLVWSVGVRGATLAERLGVPLKANAAGRGAAGRVRGGRYRLPGRSARRALSHADPRRPAAGKAGGAQHPAPAQRGAGAPLQVLRPRPHGDHRAQPRGGVAVQPGPAHRLHRVAGLAGSAPDHADRLPQPAERVRQLGVELPDLRPLGADHPAAGRRPQRARRGRGDRRRA